MRFSFQLDRTDYFKTYAWVNEICHKDAEERAIVIGVAQTFGQAFIAWVPGTQFLVNMLYLSISLISF